MEQSDRTFTEYITKLLLLEAIDCHSKGDVSGLCWVEKTLKKMALRWQELNRVKK